jgi:hypothetical protein
VVCSNRLLQDMLDLPVGDFHLATSLRMVWSGYFVCKRVFEEQGFDEPVAEVLTSVTDDGSGSTKSVEDVGLDEFYHNLVILGLGGHSFYPFGDIIYPYQNVLIPKRWWKGAHEIDTPDIKNFDNKDGVQWHHVPPRHSS